MMTISLLILARHDWTAQAFPLFLSTTTSAPAALALVAVKSVEPLSTTMIRLVGNRPRKLVTTDWIPSSSLRHGIRIVTLNSGIGSPAQSQCVFHYSYPPTTLKLSTNLLQCRSFLKP